MVPSTPPSLVTFAASAAALMTGAGTSSPSRDHVPEERYAQPSPASAGTAATAHPVSCPAGAMTGTPVPAPVASASEAFSGP